VSHIDILVNFQSAVVIVWIEYIIHKTNA
jgi:hypothetical protein